MQLLSQGLGHEGEHSLSWEKNWVSDGPFSVLLVLACPCVCRSFWASNCWRTILMTSR